MTFFLWLLAVLVFLALIGAVIVLIEAQNPPYFSDDRSSMD